MQIEYENECHTSKSWERPFRMIVTFHRIGPGRLRHGEHRVDVVEFQSWRSRLQVVKEFESWKRQNQAKEHRPKKQAGGGER